MPRTLAPSALLALFLTLVTWAVAAPQTFTQEVTHEGKTYTMQLQRVDLRSENFELLSQNASGGYDTISVVEERSYLGSVDGYPGAVSCGILKDNGTFAGAIYFDRGVTFFTDDNKVRYVRAGDYGTFTNFKFSTTPTVSAGQAGTTTYGYELAIDVDYNYFLEAGSNHASAFETIELSVGLMRAIYMRDALLRPYLGRVVIRASLDHDPYTGLNQAVYLNKVRDEWQANHLSTTNPDLVAGISPTKIGGGLAMVGNVGQTNRYSVNQSGSGIFDVVLRHEIGHNWGSLHSVGGNPEGTGLMGGNQPGRFSGPELFIVLNHRDSRIALGGILDDEGTFSDVELPPYASLDTLTFDQPRDISLDIDVLANDHDANGQAITLTSFHSKSNRGGTITRNGDRLTYTAPNGYATGSDWFLYTIEDSTGRTATGAVVVKLAAPESSLKLHFPLDETSGDTAADASPFGNSGLTMNTNFTNASAPGKYGNAINLSGSFQRIRTNDLDINSNTVTLTAWIKSAPNQNARAGIIIDTNSGSGLHLGPDRELRYSWNNDKSNWNSGLTPPLGVWTFVALVLEPNQATIHMDSGSGLQSASHTTTHDPADFGHLEIGIDGRDANTRMFLGSIDDVRIYEDTLDAAQLATIASGGGASNPSPFHQAWGVPPTDLSWSAPAGAIRYHVYLGTDRDAVANATSTSPEYLGSVTTPTFSNPPTNAKTTYFWRVDTENATATVTGEVWQFTRNGESLLSIANHSFEEGPQGLVTPIGWAAAAGSLVDVVPGGTHGTQFVSLARGTTLSQDTNHTLTGGETLTFHVDTNLDNARKIQLLAKNGATYTVLSETDGSGGDPIGSGKWPTITMQHTVAPSVNGQKLALRILSPSGWTQYDNVRIRTSSPVGTAPTWTTSAIQFSDTEENSAVSGSLASLASDADNDTLTFTKVSGPEWLTVANDGTLSGTPRIADIGTNTWQVAVTDRLTTPVVATLTIDVTDQPEAPVWLSNPVVARQATARAPYSATIAANATDPDHDDSLTFSKVDGPAWLTIAADGAIEGMPGIDDAGTNTFTVRATDSTGLSASATLNIEVSSSLHMLFSDDFERATGTAINNGWTKSVNDSRIYATGNGATKTVISTASGAPFTITNETAGTFAAHQTYELKWNAARAASANGSLIYEVQIGTLSGSTFTPLASRTGTINGLNITSKSAGPSVVYTANAADAGKRIAIRFSTLANSASWVGFDDISLVHNAEYDGDNDGITDAWEAANGLDPSINDANADTDGDGVTNLDEFANDTRPNDANSAPRFRLDLSSGTPQLEFGSSANRRYTVFFSDTLATDSWQPLHTPARGNGSTMRVSDPSATTTHRFYRLETDLP
ncbi:Ig-like domain-containing protein [Sulfuriroseicoccus oceanibius]|uniref:Cadherin-like domain-containing protein n=1 Tax=Sulfuriroseicoccus oceanibius TaxID=2707525 RepID=A0A6B3LEB6_9BACT|nr:LamG-like jellyroll fold domain-containing protein [Sulfuriroseicoccus oceanibius]QQL44827.1 cadherin-like domain-containing protein [Sulfuriroseicoccus oceanibius]